MQRFNRAFTLVEMIVVVVIFSIVMGAAYTTLRLNDRYRFTIIAKNELYTHSRRVLDSITEELQWTQQQRWTIIDNNGNDEIRFQMPLVNSMSFGVPPWGARQRGIDFADTDPDPLNGQYYVRYRRDDSPNDNNLVREVWDNVLGDIASGSITEVKATNITSLNFTVADPANPDVGPIIITVNAQYQSLFPTRTLNMELEAEVSLLNNDNELSF